jgi:hypothetical protein
MSSIKVSDIADAEQLHRELEKARRHRDATPNDVAFVWWLAGPGGAGFRLLRERHHMDADIQAAADHLNGSRDVVELWVASVPEDSFDVSSPSP